jgi:4-hydroxybenzoate polyprenyltransferase
MAFAALLRIALLPTILWDFLIGARLAGMWRFENDLLALAALLCFYHGGMVLNDWRDVREDRAFGRKRPLADGRISPLVGLVLGLGLITTGYYCSTLVSPELAAAAPWLAGIILLYDFSSGVVRQMAGPWLLAMARALSLAWPMIAVFGLNATFTPSSFTPYACYGIFFLSISRIAQKEEEGILGMRALAFLSAAALSPLVLAYGSGVQWWYLVPWVLFAAWLILPGWRLRHEVWEPHQVQAVVRHSLSSAPLILAVCLVAAMQRPQDMILALAAPLIMMLVRQMARAFPPE